ncbi:hypothetical protein [Streptomyces sp. WM6386]|uniref:hypothetical protein n=1 Tax=Streptomyces sp. WM6386 TaxID=1415558 RepID=UPI000ADB98C8|nr:hypothetical protein [Streptomyces sp. WM6386]
MSPAEQRAGDRPSVAAVPSYRMRAVLRLPRPDEWLADLGVDLFDEETRDRT